MIYSCLVAGGGRGVWLFSTYFCSPLIYLPEPGCNLLE